jgi:hypothetical protein
MRFKITLQNFNFPFFVPASDSHVLHNHSFAYMYMIYQTSSPFCARIDRVLQMT